MNNHFLPLIVINIVVTPFIMKLDAVKNITLTLMLILFGFRKGWVGVKDRTAAILAALFECKYFHMPSENSLTSA